MGDSKQTNNNRTKSFFSSIYKDRAFLLGLLLLILACFFQSLYSGKNVDFIATNGDFQNFNPIRRLLKGEIPYSNFSDYLGMGHLYLGSLFTALFGLDFRASIIAFSFLSYLCIILIALTVSGSVFRNKNNVVFLSGFAVTFILIASWNKHIVGNSARYIRGMIVPIMCSFLLLLVHAYKKRLKTTCVTDLKKLLLFSLFIGMSSGFAFAWSSDYGISTWLCMAIMTFWIAFCRLHNILKSLFATVFEVAVSLLSVFVFIELFTLGHFSNWFNSTINTGSYQSWYYNSTKHYFIYEVDFSPIIILQGIVCVAFLVLLFFNKASVESIKHYGTLAYANMVCVCADNEYRLLSGGRLFEVSNWVLLFTLLFELVHILSRFVLDPKMAGKIVAAVSITLMVFWSGFAITNESIYKPNGVYIDELGGNLTSLGDDLLATDKFLNGKKVFATYASAQEVISGDFQPSGTDYIIHVLGDKQRENYLNSFNNDDFSYTAIINDSYSIYANWMRRANWFFYRELYAEWHPVFVNTYESYWKKNSTKENYTVNVNMGIDVDRVNDSEIDILFNCNESINGIADVCIDYEIQKSSLLVYQTNLFVDDILYNETYNKRDCNFLRPLSKEYIPVNIINGKGHIKMTSNPNEQTALILNSVSSDTVYTVEKEKIITVANITNNDWDSGRSKTQNAVAFDYSDDLIYKLNNANSLICCGCELPISNIKVDKNIIIVDVNGNISVCEYPHEIIIH